ncbi:uncharacterized protein LOC135698809 [Ochlerotatus camptorhynchus]|uniref:uncharacterized protein LOC135698809 n=1 Tax=Ochlerotatus camptorhynchus TaxID=644619 RepID=UPI0031D1D668
MQTPVNVFGRLRKDTVVESGADTVLELIPADAMIDGDEIEVVDEFVYLGSLVTAENDTSREIQRRIRARNRVYFGLRRTLRSNKICPGTKLTVYKTLIKPVVLYGHETWTMLVEDVVFERKVLRTIYGGVQMNDGTWRRRMNHELHQLLGEPSIVHIAKIGRLRWDGHVEQEEEARSRQGRLTK